MVKNLLPVNVFLVGVMVSVMEFRQLTVEVRIPLVVKHFLFKVLAGALMEQAESLLDKGIHQTKIADGFEMACKKALEVLDSIAEKFPIDNREALIRCAMTSLGSKM